MIRRMTPVILLVLLGAGSLSRQEMESIWTQMGSGQSATSVLTADEATLASGGDAAIAFLMSKLRLPTSRPHDPAEVAKLIAKLDAEEWSVREEANEALKQMGESIRDELLAAAKTASSLETRTRLETLLNQLNNPVPAREATADSPAHRRAIVVLEAIGTPAAAKAILAYARHTEFAPVRREAVSAYQRTLLAAHARLMDKAKAASDAKRAGELRAQANQLLAEEGLVTADGWVQLVPFINAAQDAMAGKFAVVDGKFTAVPSAFATCAMPWRAAGAYEVELRFARKAGDAGMCVLLPVGGAQCNLNLWGWGNSVSGLEDVDEKFADDNATTVKGALDDAEHTLLIRVRPGGDTSSINVTFDGKPFIQWAGKESSLQTNHNWTSRGPDVLGLGGHQNDLVFSSIRVRPLPPAP